MNQHLVTSILFDGTLALEWEESSLAENRDRLRFEKLLLDMYNKERANAPGKWMIVLGLSEDGIPLSQALEFWRSFASNWVRQVRTTPDGEQKREALRLDLADEDVQSFLGRIPPMIGIDSADTAFLSRVWQTMHETFTFEIRDFRGTVEEWFRKLAPTPKHVDRIHFHLAENPGMSRGRSPFWQPTQREWMIRTALGTCRSGMRSRNTTATRRNCWNCWPLSTRWGRRTLSSRP